MDQPATSIAIGMLEPTWFKMTHGASSDPWTCRTSLLLRMLPTAWSRSMAHKLRNWARSLTLLFGLRNHFESLKILPTLIYLQPVNLTINTMLKLTIFVEKGSPSLDTDLPTTWWTSTVRLSGKRRKIWWDLCWDRKEGIRRQLLKDHWRSWRNTWLMIHGKDLESLLFEQWGRCSASTFSDSSIHNYHIKVWRYHLKSIKTRSHGATL